MLQAVLETALDAVIVMRTDGTVADWNRHAEEIFGWSKGEVGGRALSELVIPQAHRAAHSIGLQHYMESGEGPVLNRRIEISALHRDGHELQVELSITPSDLDHETVFIGFLRDISDRKRTENALRESETRFRMLAETLPHLVWTARPDGYTDWYNDRWYAFTGFPRGEGGDQSWEPILHPDDLPMCREAWANSVQTGEPYEIEYRFFDRQTGDYRWQLGRAMPQRASDGTIVKWIGSCTDIHDLRAAQEELRRINETLEARVDERTRERETALNQLHAAQKLETLGQLTGGVAHDFNNLLTPIMGSFDLLKRRLPPDDARNQHLIEAGMQAASRAASLIHRLLMSLACAFSASLETLVLFRWLQGVGAAAMMGVNGALMRFTWPKALLGRGIGYNALVIAGTAAVGPALAALLLSLGRWPTLFLINVPTGLLSLGLALAFLPRPAPAARSFDWRSALLGAATFGGLLLTLSHAVHGLAAGQLLPTALVGLLAGTWLFRRIGSSPRPMIPIDLIRRPALRTAYAASIFAFAAQMCLLVALPFLLESRLHMDVATIGLLILPLPVGVAIASPLAGRLAERPWAGRMSAIGLCLLASCLGLMAMALHSFPVLLVMTLAMGLSGIGFGLFQTPNNHVMLKTAPIDRAGAAAGMLSLSRLLGQGFGALLAALSLRLAGQSSLLPLYLAVIMALWGAGFACRRKYGCSGDGLRTPAPGG